MLGVDTSSLGAVLGGTLIAAERVMLEERPDAVLVLGDTNSCIAALMARRMRIPVYHMEAGNRCFDLNVPEETNRRLVDHVADFNLVYTEHARRNLLAEGLHPRRIIKTGLADARGPRRLPRTRSTPPTSSSDSGSTEGGYFLVSAHREENVDHPDRLRALLDCLVGRAHGVRPPGLRLDPPAHPQAARGPARVVRARGHHLQRAVRLPRLQPAPAVRGVLPVGLGHHRRGVDAARLPRGDPARLDRAPGGPRHGRHPDDRAGPRRRGRGGRRRDERRARTATA